MELTIRMRAAAPADALRYVDEQTVLPHRRVGAANFSSKPTSSPSRWSGAARTDPSGARSISIPASETRTIPAVQFQHRRRRSRPRRRRRGERPSGGSRSLFRSVNRHDSSYVVGMAARGSARGDRPESSGAYLRCSISGCRRDLRTRPVADVGSKTSPRRIRRPSPPARRAQRRASTRSARPEGEGPNPRAMLVGSRRRRRTCRRA